jgi:hypothetical protein
MRIGGEKNKKEANEGGDGRVNTTRELELRSITVLLCRKRKVKEKERKKRKPFISPWSCS